MRVLIIVAIIVLFVVGMEIFGPEGLAAVLTIATPLGLLLAYCVIRLKGRRHGE
jgi:hypothetical protein